MFIRMHTGEVVVAVMLLVGGGFATATELWTQWRGPHRDGQLVTSKPWPNQLSEQRLSSRWAKPLGPSYSGPIVTGDRVFTTETEGRKYEVVRALDRRTGRQIWEAKWAGAMNVPFFAAANGSWIRATPTLDGDRLYVAGMRDVLVCLSAADGSILWKLDFVEETGSSLPTFGFVSSPLIWKDHVFVQAGGSFVKVDKRSGKVVWRTLKDSGGMYGSAFSSPIMATIDGVEQLLVQTRSQLAGVSPSDGSVLWSRKVKAFRGMNILTPTVIGDKVFTSSYGGGSMMLRIKRSGDKWESEEVWTRKTQAYMSSPVVVDGHIYLHLRNQRFVCLDAETGEQRWISRPYGKYWSMITNGKLLLALDQRGDLLLIDPSPEAFKVLDKRRVARDSWAHLAIAGNEVFVRDLGEMKCFRWE